MNSVVNWVVVGRFGKPHGIKGFVTVHSFTHPRENILEYANWHAVIKGSYQPLKILHAELTHKAIIARVAGYETRELAARLTNVDIAVDISQFPILEEGDYYWHELTGMQVINQQDENLGVVKELLSTGSNDVLIVEGEKRTLIPWIPGQFVLNVDKVARVIRVDWDSELV